MTTKRGTQVMSRTDNKYETALSNIKVPLLVLDNNWHKLFARTSETPEIKKLVKKMNELLKEQGRLNTEQKKLKAGKRKVMDEILRLADKYDGRKESAVEKAMERHKKLLEDCSERLKTLEEDIRDTDAQIEEVNYTLMLKTMEQCYKRLKENQKEIEYYHDWIEKTRTELKENIIRKQEKEETIYELYTYMHNIFGRDVIDIFDMYYHPEEYRPKRKEEGYIE